MTQITLAELEWDRPASLVLIALESCGYDEEKVIKWLEGLAEERGLNDSWGRLALILVRDKNRLKRIIEKLKNGMMPRKDVLESIRRELKSK